MANTLRNLVSGDKRRYQAGGFNLDLTYITPRLIAMGLPGKGVTSLWRNRVEEVARFLEQNHSGHYKIFSLGKSTAEFFNLRNDTAWYGWSSKKAPPLELLNRILLGINDWLSADPRNIAVIHCKEGRERSGVVIAAYLVKSGVYQNAQQALDYYASMRSKQHEGVSTPSQIRYVNYICSVPQPPPAKKVFLRRIVLRPVPAYSTFTPVVEIFNSSVVPAVNLLTLRDLKTFQQLDFCVPIDLNLPIQGDVYINVSNKMSLLGLKTNVLTFRVGFHTSFIPNRWVLTRNELDGEFAGPVTDSKLRKGFTVEILTTDAPFDPLPVDPAYVYQSQQVPQYTPVPPQYQAQPQQQVPQQYYSQMQSIPQQSYMSEESYVTRDIVEEPIMTNVAPPPIDRGTKDNRQAILQASDAAMKAAERLRSISFSGMVPNNSQFGEQIPPSEMSQTSNTYIPLSQTSATSDKILPYNEEPRQMNAF